MLSIFWIVIGVVNLIVSAMHYGSIVSARDSDITVSPFQYAWCALNGLLGMWVMFHAGVYSATHTVG